MSENSANNGGDSKFGWARLENSRQGCFSGNGTAIEFRFDDAENASVKIIADEKENDFVIERGRAEEFLKRIIYLGRKPEVFSQSGWTTVRYATVEWRDLNFCDEPSGKIGARSNEWTVAEMEEFLPKIKDAKIAAEIKEMLAKGLHRRAIEIQLETEKFVGELFPAK